MVRKFLNSVYGIFLTIKYYRGCQEVVTDEIIENGNIELEVYDDEFYRNNPFYNN